MGRFKNNLIFILIFILITFSFSFAQTSKSNTVSTSVVVPTPDPLESAWNISVSGSFSSVSNASTNNGFQTSEAIRFATHWTARADTFIVTLPSVVVVTAGPEYRASLAHLIKPNTQYVINTSNMEAFVNLGLGTSRTSSVASDGTTTLSKAVFAYKIGGGFDIKVSNTMYLRPLDISYVRASMLQNGGMVLGNHVQFAAGLGLRF